ERGWRWCRRNPRVAGPLYILAGVIAAGFAGVFWQWQRAEAGRVVAQQEHALAEENLRLALEAVDHYHTRVSESRLLNEPGQQPLRKELLEGARTFYARFVRERQEDPSMRQYLGRALVRLANITGAIESKPKAVELMQQAV